MDGSTLPFIAINLSCERYLWVRHSATKLLMEKWFKYHYNYLPFLIQLTVKVFPLNLIRIVHFLVVLFEYFSFFLFFGERNRFETLGQSRIIRGSGWTRISSVKSHVPQGIMKDCYAVTWRLNARAVTILGDCRHRHGAYLSNPLRIAAIEGSHVRPVTRTKRDRGATVENCRTRSTRRSPVRRGRDRGIAVTRDINDRTFVDGWHYGGCLKAARCNLAKQRARSRQRSINSCRCCNLREN